MSQIKISQLQDALTLLDGGPEYLMIIQGGVNKKISINTFLNNIKSDVEINKSLGAVNVTLNGQEFAALFKLDAVANKIGIGTGNPEALLHVNGDLKIGKVGSAGKLILSSESITITGTPSDTFSINTGYSVTHIKTIDTSLTSKYMTLSNPVSNNEVKIIAFSEGHTSKASNMNYVIEGTFVGYTQVKFSKIGDSVNLLSYNGKWIVSSYNGVTLV